MSVSNRSFEATRDLYHFWNTCGRKAVTINDINYTLAPVVPRRCEILLCFTSVSPQMAVGGFCAHVLNRGKAHTENILKALKTIFIKMEHWNTC